MVRVWDKLKAAFVDFVAPDALHANDADTIGGETSAELHNAGALTGVAPLSVIPAELTGKNAATATSAAKLTNARTITIAGDATGSVSFDGSANKTLTLDVTYATSAGSATNATTAGRTLNDYGTTLPTPNNANGGKFFYRTDYPPGLYYCARTGSSLVFMDKKYRHNPTNKKEKNK
jgi:hypothetical protein